MGINSTKKNPIVPAYVCKISPALCGSVPSSSNEKYEPRRFNGRIFNLLIGKIGKSKKVNQIVPVYSPIVSVFFAVSTRRPIPEKDEI